MSGTLGTLVVEVAANVARFQSDCARMADIAESRARQMDQAFNLVGNSLKALGAAAVVGLSFEKMRSQVQGAIDSAAGLKDMAERTGGTVEKLSGLVGVAKMSGTSTDELAAGIQRLAKAMNEAEAGGKTQAAAFQAIGISTKDLRGQRPDEVFEKIARKQADYADGAGKVAVMQALLGKSGANLIPVMKDLAERGELVAKVTAEQAAMADQYTKTLGALDAVQGSAYKKLAFELLPAMSAFAETMLDSAKQTNVLASGVNALAKDDGLRGWAENGALAIGTTVEAVTALIKTARAVGGSFQAVGADIALPFQIAATLSTGEGGLADRLQAVRKAIGDRNQIVAQANARYDELWNGDLTSFTRGLRARFDLQRQARVNAGFPYDPMGPKPQVNAKAATDQGLAGAGFVEQLRRQVEQQEAGRFAMLRLEAAQKGVGDAAEEYIQRLERAHFQADRIAQVVERTAAAQREQARIDAVNGMGNDMFLGLVQQAEALTLTANEQRRLTLLRQFDISVQRELAGATADTAVQIQLYADKLRKDVIGAYEELEKREKDWASGASRALRNWAEDAANEAKNAERFVNGSLDRMTDAVVNFAKTGKLSLHDVFAFMAEEYIRQQARMLIGGGGGSLGLVGNLMGFLGGGAGFLGAAAKFNYNDLGSVAHLATGMSYVPYDGFPAILHEGERVMTKAENAASGGGQVIDMSGAVYQIGQGVSRSEVVSGIKQANAQLKADLMRTLRQQGVSA